MLRTSRPVGRRRTRPVWPAPPTPMQLTRAAGLTPETHEFVFLHVHSHLDLFVNGKRVVVPAGIGIDVHNQGGAQVPQSAGRVDRLRRHQPALRESRASRRCTRISTTGSSTQRQRRTSSTGSASSSPNGPFFFFFFNLPFMQAAGETRSTWTASPYQGRSAHDSAQGQAGDRRRHRQAARAIPKHF